MQSTKLGTRTKKDQYEIIIISFTESCINNLNLGKCFKQKIK
jgi:hypothetical protein